MTIDMFHRALKSLARTTSISIFNDIKQHMMKEIILSFSTVSRLGRKSKNIGIYMYKNTSIKENQSDTASVQVNDCTIAKKPISSNIYATQKNINNQVKLPKKDVDNQPLAALTIEYQCAIKNYSHCILHSRFIQRTHNRNQLSKNICSDYSYNFLQDSSSNDLLTKKLAINALIADMDQFEADALFIKEQPLEILRLLAPDAITPQQVQPLGLIQREHHMISLDSHFHMADATTNISESG